MSYRIMGALVLLFTASVIAAVMVISSLTTADMERLGKRAADGDMGAIDEIARIANDLYKNIDYDKESRRVLSNLKLMRAAFAPIGTQAGEGSPSAMRALAYANQDQHLSVFVPEALGIAAGMGNDDALKMLLNYEQHDFLLSSVVFALHNAANKNVDEAVSFLIEVISDPDTRPLWRAASQGLVGAASRGNLRAIEALDIYNESR